MVESVEWENHNQESSAVDKFWHSLDTFYFFWGRFRSGFQHFRHDTSRPSPHSKMWNDMNLGGEGLCLYGLIASDPSEVRDVNSLPGRELPLKAVPEVTRASSSEEMGHIRAQIQ